MLTQYIDRLSGSLRSKESREWTQESHFRWSSIKTFINITTAMSSAVFNFDVFSNICSHVRLFDFLALELTVGISYLCMDSFIKQYTKSFDCNRNLNPLFRGISYGQFLQTGYFSLIHATFIVDTVRFFVGAIKDEPSWTLCGSMEHNINVTCVPMKHILLECNKNRTTEFQDTSAFLYYLSFFTYSGKSTTTTSRLFLTAIVWIFTFLLSTLTTDVILKIFKISAMFRGFTTIITFTLLIFEMSTESMAAFSDVLGVNSPSSWASSMQHVTYTYGVGFLGVYDFGAVSPYTMMDTASVIFMITFTFFAFLRSWIVRMLYLVMIKCVVIDESYVISTHTLLYAVLPLTTEFMLAKKFFILYVFGNLTVTLIALEIFLISTMAQFLHCEFRNVKQIYIIGIVCATGFIISLILTALSTSYGKRNNMVIWEWGLEKNILVLYLSGFRVAVIMWLYGLKRFATDIHFWLHFYPTRYWLINWSVLPIILFGFMVNEICMLPQLPQHLQLKTVIWMAITALVVLGSQIKTIAKYLLKNNFIGLFKANKFYGPPESEYRKRRQFYSEVSGHKKCRHNCMVLDEWFDCDHEQLVYIESTTSAMSAEPSILNIYKTEGRKPPRVSLEAHE